MTPVFTCVYSLIHTTRMHDPRTRVSFNDTRRVARESKFCDPTRPDPEKPERDPTR